MSFFGKLFGNRNENDEITRIKKIMEKFIEVSFFGLVHLDKRRPNQGKTVLLYMFGALDSCAK